MGLISEATALHPGDVDPQNIIPDTSSG
jgi:hypothetical protein